MRNLDFQDTLERYDHTFQSFAALPPIEKSAMLRIARYDQERAARRCTSIAGLDRVWEMAEPERVPREYLYFDEGEIGIVPVPLPLCQTEGCNDIVRGESEYCRRCDEEITAGVLRLGHWTWIDTFIAVFLFCVGATAVFAVGVRLFG